MGFFHHKRQSRSPQVRCGNSRLAEAGCCVKWYTCWYPAIFKKNWTQNQKFKPRRFIPGFGSCSSWMGLIPRWVFGYCLIVALDWFTLKLKQGGRLAPSAVWPRIYCCSRFYSSLLKRNQNIPGCHCNRSYSLTRQQGWLRVAPFHSVDSGLYYHRSELTDHPAN